jgi:iron complex outermembrane receptor protein
VINIVLRQQTDATLMNFEVGQTYEGDGRVLHGGANTGWKIGDGGFFNLTGEYRDREETNRAGPDLFARRSAARHAAPRRCGREGHVPVV